MKWGDSFVCLQEWVSLSARTVLQSPASGPAVLEATCKDTNATTTALKHLATGSLF